MEMRWDGFLGWLTAWWWLMMVLAGCCFCLAWAWVAVCVCVYLSLPLARCSVTLSLCLSLPPCLSPALLADCALVILGRFPQAAKAKPKHPHTCVVAEASTYTRPYPAICVPRQPCQPCLPRLPRPLPRLPWGLSR